MGENQMSADDARRQIAAWQEQEREREAKMLRAKRDQTSPDYFKQPEGLFPFADASTLALSQLRIQQLEAMIRRMQLELESAHELIADKWGDDDPDAIMIENVLVDARALLGDKEING